ncbi:MAG: G5 domain-containing protein, partial [Eubacteriales bacterium]|nr:G5 domain-containing protein [Eubacteriales bacterium]
MRNRRMWGKRIAALGLGLMLAFGTAAAPQAQAAGNGTDSPQSGSPQVTLVYIDGKRTVQCAPDVDVDAVAARAAVTLAQGSTTASPVQTIQTQRVASNGAETLDEAGLFAYLTEENPLQVQYTKQLVSFETVHFTTVIEEDDTLYEDEIRVVRAGVDGE